MTAVTWDSAAKNTYITLSAANLRMAGDGSQAFVESAKATQYQSTGKWYYEVTVGGSDNTAGTRVIGLGKSTASLANAANVGGADSTGYQDNAVRLNNGGSTGYGASYASGDIISVLWDADAGTTSFWKNGADQGAAYSSISGSYTPMATVNGNTDQTLTANFGATAFTYTPTAGYVGWDVPAPTPGNGAATLEYMTASGLRIAAGSATMVAMTGVGGYHGLGAAVLEALTMSGSGGTKSGVMILEALTAAGTGSQAAFGAAVLEALTAEGTGYDSAIWTFAGTAPAPSLSSSVIAGEVLVFAGRAPAPRLVATLDGPHLLVFAGSAPRPRLSATLLTGNAMTFAGSAPVPTLIALGYPASIITFAGRAPAPRLIAVLSAATASAFRTWVLNTRKGALTEYGSEWAFNSYATFCGAVLAIGPSGLVVLGTQGDDAGTAIDATLRTGQDGFGSSLHKRVPRIYVSGEFADDMLFKTITVEGGTRVYSLGFNGVTGLQQRRVGVGKGPRSRYWQIEIENVRGGDFSMSDIELYPIGIRRRVL